MSIFPTINLIKTGENILALRIKKGLSVRALQQMLGFATPQAIYKWQQGLTLPSVDNLVALSSILDTPIDKILVVEVPVGRAG